MTVPTPAQPPAPLGTPPAASGGAGLVRALGGTQISLIAMGGAIGTGLFMGSGFAIAMAGPSVLISFAIGGLVALLLMGCLAEMTVAHPENASFGLFTDLYVGPTAGALVRYAYLWANLLAIGTESTAVALCMGVWFPAVPGWVWILGLTAVLVGVNLIAVRVFGAVESAFSVLKIAAIVLFIVLGVVYIARMPTGPDGAGPLAALVGGDFFPHGFAGTWAAVVVAIFSYISVELIAITAAEARDPGRAVVSALRATVFRLGFFYLATLALILTITPWSRMAGGGSPFVFVMADAGLPRAAAFINLVVLVAALSAMNSQIYGASRTLFGLARAGHVPGWVAAVNRRGAPVNALLLSTVGMAVAVAVNLANPSGAILVMISVSAFGALFTWLMIFVSHIGFRRRVDVSALPFRMWAYPWATGAGLALMAGVLATTLFLPEFRLTLLTGVPFLILVGLAHRWRRASAAPDPGGEGGA